MEDDFTRISLSTADLEDSPGDIISDKEKVFENAPNKVYKWMNVIIVKY